MSFQRSVLVTVLAAAPTEAPAALTPPPPAPPAPPPAPMPTATANCTVTFRASWSAATHPRDFPNDPHFSSLTGSTHSSCVVFWAPGQAATEGIRQMAERGARSTFETEVRAAIAAGSAGSVLAGNALNRSPGVVSFDFEVSRT